MGQDQSQSSVPAAVPIYADDGVTVIGTVNGVKSEYIADEFSEPSHQRWFDSPGPQTASVKRLPPQVFDIFGEGGHGAVQAKGPTSALAMGDGQPCVQVRNRTSQPLAVSCGGSPVTVPAGSTIKVHALRPLAQVWAPDMAGCGLALCELDDLPIENSQDCRAVVALKEVGGVVCVSLDYCHVPRLPENQSCNDDSSQFVDQVSSNMDKPSSTDQLQLESQLQDALARGDEEAARLILKQL